MMEESGKKKEKKREKRGKRETREKREKKEKREEIRETREERRPPFSLRGPPSRSDRNRPTKGRTKDDPERDLHVVY